MVVKQGGRFRRGSIAWLVAIAVLVALLAGVAFCWHAGILLRNPAEVLDPIWSGCPANFQQPDGHLRMVAELAKLYEREHETNLMLDDTRLVQFREQLKNGLGEMNGVDEFTFYYILGAEELKVGNDQLAIDHFDKAAELLENGLSGISRDVAEDFAFNYGVANLRLGETQNCCARKGPDNCVMPIQGSAIHTKQQGSQRAIEIYTQLLKRASKDSTTYWRALWLLNIAHMTIGTYPDEVPKPFLIPPKAFESEEPFPKFPNIAATVGLDLFGSAGAEIVDDFNNDGYLDVILSGWDLGTQVRVFLNNGDGTFTDYTKQSGLLGIVGGSNLMQADYNNDGFLDFFLMRGGWLGNGGLQPVSLIRNNGDGTFTDVTYDAGLGGSSFPSQSGGWADYDNDGNLDLFVCGEFQGDYNRPGNEADFAPCRLFHNNGNGTFSEVTEQAGVTNGRYAKGASWGDYDGDRFPDLYVSNYRQPNRLYHNNRDGTFTDVAEELGVTNPLESFTCWFWDFDNDGLLDIYVAAYAAETYDLALSYRGLEPNVERACLYRGKPGGGFEEVSQQCNLDKPNAPMSANFGDLDNDGYLDLYLGTGRPAFATLMPNVMYHNRRGKSFADVTTAGGFGNLQKGHGIAFADLDNDGDQDVFEQMGGALNADKFYNTLYENPGFGNQWIAIKLVGTYSNRSAIGARIRADIVEDGEPRSVYKYVNSGGSFGASPLRQSIGLGKAEKIERLEILWPTTGKTEVFNDVPTNKFLRIVEGEGHYTDLALKSFTLGGNAR